HQYTIQLCCGGLVRRSGTWKVRAIEVRAHGIVRIQAEINLGILSREIPVVVNVACQRETKGHKYGLWFHADTRRLPRPEFRGSICPGLSRLGSERSHERELQ